MALTFDYEKTLQTGDQPFICHEKDSKLYNYYIRDERALDKSAQALYGIYNNVTFSDENNSLTTRAVSRIGIKNFPGIGGIGFYKDAYSDESHIVSPIHTEEKRYEAPVLEVVEIVDNMLHFVVSPPDSLKYTCYRVVVKQKFFAFEYITYKTDYYADVPTVKGEYICHCIGYDENNGTVSLPSNELSLLVAEGTDGWAPDFTDLSQIAERLDNIEKEIKNYTDEEIQEGVKEILGGA